MMVRYCFSFIKILEKSFQTAKNRAFKTFSRLFNLLNPNPLAVMILQVGDDGNVCTSVVEFNPKKEDDQKFLSCQARNELIDDIAVEDQWKITVYCKFINVL